MKLSEYAKRLGIKYQTAFLHYKKGLIKGAYQLSSGTIIVPEDEPTVQKSKQSYTIVYARVNSSDRKNQLDSQADRLAKFCEANGWIVNEVVKECASGLNDNRPKLQKIFKDNKATRLVVEHKDRLTRFGFEYIKSLMKNCEIVVANESNNDGEDLMNDFVSIVTCFCARLYGLRRSRRKTESIIKIINQEE